MVAVGVTTTETKLETGLVHVYVLAPLAVKVNVCPAQTVVDEGVMLNVGEIVFCPTDTVPILIQPFTRF